MRWPWSRKRSAKHPHYGLIEHAFADAHGEIRAANARAENLARQLAEEKAKIRSLAAQLREARKKLGAR